MTDIRIIKKYPNRRLYDTAISSYITLADVKLLVLESEPFQVVDAKTNEDLTRSILLQIIAEEEDGGQPIFTTGLLSQIIRFYGNSMQRMLSNYLEKSLEVFVDQQRVVREQARSLMDTNPMALMTQIAERNLNMWKTMSQSFYNPTGTGSGGTAANAPREDEDPLRRK
jgi:polyhydroxyalkanoate synthesis repressor PhaR